MNKWLRLALNSFIGIIVLNLLYGLLFGGNLGLFSLAALFTIAVKALYLLMIVSFIAGIILAAKDYIYSGE